MQRWAMLFLMCSGVAAQVRAEPVFEAGAGLVALTIPAYPGAEEQKSYLLPLPYLYYKDEHITLDEEGLIGNLFESEQWELDASFSGGIPVNSEESSARAGMPDLDWTIEAGPRLLYYFTDKHADDGFVRAEVFARAAFATDLSYIDQVGFRVGVGLEFEQHFSLSDGKKLIWTNKLTANWANNEFLDYYYGVAEAYARPDRISFNSQSGYSGTEFSTGLAVRFNQVLLGTFARYQNFSGSNATQSPLLPSHSNFSIGIGLVWIISSNRY